MTSRGHAKAIVHKLIVETYRHDLKKACRGARPPNQLRKLADLTLKGHAKVLVPKLIEETSIHDHEKACRGACPQPI